MAEVENRQRHMVLYQTDLYYFKRQSKPLTKDEKYDYCSKDKGALLSPAFQQGTLASREYILDSFKLYPTITF